MCNTINIINGELIKRVTGSMSKKQLVLFDGVCQFCNGSVQFIINRDPNNQFLFAPIQSPLGQALMEHYQLVDEPDTFVLVSEGGFLTRSDAVLSTVKKLSGLWPIFSVFKVLPKRLRDAAYTLFGRYRYKLFGRLETCQIPTDELKAKFIGEWTLEEWSAYLTE